MFTRFPTDSRGVVKGARDIACELDSPTVEAEHLLLALTGRQATTVRDVLAGAGLDRDRVRAALDAEFEGSLAPVGITLTDFDLRATPAPSRSPRWGTSAKLALQRSAKIAEGRRDRRLTPAHILLGLLRAPAGTVPRMLDRAGIDRTELVLRVEASL